MASVVVGGARSKGAVSNRVIGWRWGCFFFGSYSLALVVIARTYTSSNKLLDSNSQILNPSPSYDNLDDRAQGFNPLSSQGRVRVWIKYEFSKCQ
jgi:hypothetical protein